MENQVLHVALVEAALETVPVEISNHPSVIKNARRKGKRPWETLLDVSLHYHAMKEIEDRGKRGRPDIIHVSLLEALESPLNRKGLLRIYVHTYKDYLIFIRSETRIPRNYNRFVGLMEQLFSAGAVPPGSRNPLIYIKEGNVMDLVKEVGLDGYVLLHEHGDRLSLTQLVEFCIKNNLLITIGGFPHGDFREDIVKKALRKVSIYPEALVTWIVLSRIIAGAELLFNLVAY